MPFRSLLMALAVALVLVGCDAASDTPSSVAPDDAPLGMESKTSHDILSDEEALDADLLRSTVLSDLPLSTALRAVDDDFEFRKRGAVFVLSDADGPNEVIAFARGEDGTLTPFGTYATGGMGSGGGLGPATDPLVIGGHRGKYLYAANPGSDEISVFRINGDGLDL